jgi:hypothetical protein
MKTTRSNSQRTLSVEALEPRCVLSGNPVGSAPQIFLDPFASEVSEGRQFVITGRVLDGDTPTNLLNATVNFGTGPEPVSINPDGSFRLSYVPPYEGSIDITLTVQDDQSNQAVEVMQVQSVNVLPVIDVRLLTPAVVGQPINAVGSFEDPGDDVWSGEVYYNYVDQDNPGDVEPLQLNPDKTFNLSHLYDSPGDYTIRIVISDGNSEVPTSSEAYLVVSVRGEPNDPPVLPPQQTTINEGQTATFNVVFSGIDSGRLHEVFVDYGSGYVPVALGADGKYTVSKFYGQDSSDITGGAYLLPVRVVEAEGDVTDATFLVFVNNVVPDVNARPDQVIYVGESADKGLFSFRDPGEEYAADGSPLWRYEIYLNGVLALPKGVPVLPNTDYSAIFDGLAVGTYNVTVKVYDDDSLGSDSFFITVLPKEVPPVEPPVTPPVTPPTQPPVTPPVTPPTQPPVTPPVTPPKQPPVTPPVTPPTEPPVTPPVTPPTQPPVTPPVTPPTEPPVTPPVTPPTEPPVTPPVTPPAKPPVTPPTIFFPPTAPPPVVVPQLVPPLPPVAIQLPGYVAQPVPQSVVPPVGYFYFSEQHYPPVPHLADRTIDEGSVMEYQGWFDDADQVDSWRGRVDYGDGSGWHELVIEPGRRFTLQHFYGQDGDYKVIVEIYDSYGLWGRDTMTVHVNNVLPSVKLNGKKLCKTGDNMQLDGSFEDPGADVFTGVVDYGDGSKPAGIVLDGKSFKLSHKYEKEGTYKVVVKIFDGKGHGSSEFTVEVDDVAARAPNGSEPGLGEENCGYSDAGCEGFAGVGIDNGSGGGQTNADIDLSALDDLFAGDEIALLTLGVVFGGIYVGSRQLHKRDGEKENAHNEN